MFKPEDIVKVSRKDSRTLIVTGENFKSYFIVIDRASNRPASDILTVRELISQVFPNNVEQDLMNSLNSRLRLKPIPKKLNLEKEYAARIWAF